MPTTAALIKLNTPEAIVFAVSKIVPALSVINLVIDLNSLAAKSSISAKPSPPMTAAPKVSINVSRAEEEAALAFCKTALFSAY